VRGYSDISCSSGEHFAILATGALGGLVIVAGALAFSLLFYDMAPKSKIGKRNGRFDFFFAIARIISIIMYQVVDNPTTAQIVILVVLAISTYYGLKNQFYFRGILNDLQNGILVGSTFLAAASLAFSFYEDGKENMVFLGVGLGVFVLGSAAGIFGNKSMVNHVKGKILRQVDHYNNLFMNPELDEKINEGEIKDINKSYLELICQQALDVSGRYAVKQEIEAFPSAEWVDVAVRFIIHSYMDKDAIILANQLFAIAFRQFPKEKSLYLTYIAYIRSFFTFLHGEEYNLLMILLKRHSLAFDERSLVYFYQQSISQTASSEEGDDQLNYAAFMEYQALEKAAKEAHVGSVSELRDFWSGIR